MNNKVLVVLGPTATGKTDLALRLAKKFNGELVACDSRQVYRGLDIGTGKEAGEKVKVEKGNGFWILDGIKVWMYDVADPTTRYSVNDYVVQSTEVINKILSLGKLPIIVGGTGLYLKGLLEGFSNLSIPSDPKVREELEGLTLGELQKRLKEKDLDKYKSLNNSERQNPRRLIRRIELIYMYLYNNNNLQFPMSNTQKWDVLKIGLTAPRPVLNLRIDQRLDSRLSDGLIEEGRRLHEMALPFSRFHELGLEYRVLAELLEGEIDEGQFIEILKVKIHQYAKRQMVWFKKEKKVIWFDIGEDGFTDRMESEVQRWYDLDTASGF